MSVFSKARSHHQIKFGTDGWRALIAKEFTYDNLNLLVAGLAAYIIEKYPRSAVIVIGYDARFLADKFACFAAEILNSFGIPVKMIDHPVPTPVIAHAALQQRGCGALMFTASHNPPEYMGIKYIPEYAGPATTEITDKILEHIDIKAMDAQKHGRENVWKGKANATTEKFDPSESYFNAIRKIINFDLLKKLNTGNKLKITYDPMYGVGRAYTDKLLLEAGFIVETLHDNWDPTFGGALPDPREDRLTELMDRVKINGSIIGCANDGDADRFAFVGPDGIFYPANKSLPIVLKYLVEKRGFKGCVARTIATTHLLDDIAAKLNLDSIETTVGFKWLSQIMRERDTVIACEESGGMSILGHIPEKDGILAILLMAEILAVTGKNLSTLWQDVQDFVGKKYFYDRLDLHLDGNAKDEFVKIFAKDSLKEVAGFKVVKVDAREGSKIYLDNGSWLLARPSGTEAMCRVYFEANNQEDLNKVVNFVKGAVKSTFRTSD